MNPDSVYAVIPVYNNAETVRDIAERTLKILPHVLLVDDGSTDIDLKPFCEERGIEFLRHEVNQGKGAALRDALNYLAMKPEVAYMIALDADGQHYPEDIPLFYPLMEENDWTLIVGCRDFSGENIPDSSKFGREFSNFWIRLETGIRVEDSQSGFRAYPVRYLSKLRFLSTHYNFEAEILTRAAWGNLEIRNLPVRVHYPPREKRVSHFKPFRDNFRLSCIHFHLVALRLLPFPKQKLREKKREWSIFRPRELFTMLLKENAEPAGLGVSAGIGSFLAVLPLPACHIIVILYIAERLHLNKIMALAIQNLYMPPLSPFLCIELGYFLRYGHWLTELSFRTCAQELHLRLWEWLLGSLILAPFWGIVSGFAVWFIASLLNRRSHEKA